VVPPLTGTAVKLTDVPEQTLLADALIDRLTGKTGLTDITTVLDSVGFDTHPAEEYKVHVTLSLLDGT
jgi:hypothetical protein